MSKINVKSKSPKGFRRAGIAFDRDGIELDTSKLKKADLDAIRNEPNLIVVEQAESGAERKQREAAEKAAADKAAADKAEADKAAADKAEADKAEADKAEADKAEADKAAKGKAK